MLESHFDLRPVSRMRRTVGERMAYSKHTAPHFYLKIDILLDELQSARQRMRATFGTDAPSLNDCVVRASALALRDFPELNSALVGNDWRVFRQVNIGIAVATKGGLVVPVLRGVERKHMVQIASESRDLVAKARSNKLSPDDYAGGTFTVSNLGSFGVHEFIAILNPPQAAILALGLGRMVPIVKEGQIVPATVMTATLSVDHRIADGALAAGLLSSVKQNLETPGPLLEALDRTEE